LLCCEDGSLKKMYNNDNITVLDNKRCFNKIDLNILQDIIDHNIILNEIEPLDLGKQTWKNHRLIYLYLDGLSLTSLSENIGDLENIEVLSFNNNKIQNIPSSIGKLSKLQGLAFNNNNIFNIPENIWKLKELEELHCNNNQINSLPESIGKLNKLQKLEISNNNLFTIPNNIGKLSNLEYLNVSNNKITYLPESICLLNLNIYFNSFIAGNNFICDNIPQCTERFPGFNYEYNETGIPKFVDQNCSPCDLMYTEIIQIPSNINIVDNNNCFYKKDLKTLNDFIQINKLPIETPLQLGQQIWENGRLYSLSINNKSIESIPNTINNLSNLNQLNLNNNNLRNIPDNISKLINLKSLKISNNQITSLPKSISKLKNIQSLQIDHNKIAIIPEDICNLNLKSNKASNFLAGNNFICQNIPDCVQNLNGFNYYYDSYDNLVYNPQNCINCETDFHGIIKTNNNISNLDNNCFYKSDLDVIQKIINLNSELINMEPLEIGSQTWSNGRLTTFALIDSNIKNLPSDIGNLSELQILHLDRNRIHKLPKSIGDLSNLQELVLDENKINILPNNFCKLTNLMGLSIDNNLLIKLPDNFGNLKNLKELYLNYNKINELPNSFGNLINLKILLIYYNELKSFPNTIGNLNNLQVLYSSNNQIDHLPESISNLSSLHKLWINSNQLKTLPNTICNLPENCDINISYNCLPDKYQFSCIEQSGHHLGFWCK